MIDIPGLTPEQEKLVAEKLAAAKVEAVKKYDAEAHRFREWINTHPALWAAQRFGTVGFIVGAALGSWLYSLWTVIGK